jgi:preprotein translocase subunit SecG
MIDTMLQTILLVAMILISVSLTAVILLQRSEGGALGMGGGPSGFMTARGAGNLLTRATSVLAVLFFVCAISLTVAGNFARGSRSVIDADAVGAIAVGNEQAAPAEQAAPTPAAPVAPSLDDLEASLPAASAPAPAPAQ